MAERTLETNGDIDGDIKADTVAADADAIPEEEQQNAGDINGDIVPNTSSDRDNSDKSPSASVDNSKTSNASDGAGLDNSDTDSTDLTITDSSSISKSREEKLRQARDAFERERKRKIAEILEAQRQAEEFRVKQQEDRRRKIEEMRRKDQERRKTVEERRRRMVELEEERRASLLRRSQARESRIDTMRSSRMPARMAMSCTFGSGEAALNALSRPRVAFGSSTPREIFGSTPDISAIGKKEGQAGRDSLRRSSMMAGSTACLTSTGTTGPGKPSDLSAAKKASQLRKAVSTASLAGPSVGGSTEDEEVAHLTPNRGARSASRGGTTDSASRRQPFSAGQTRSASVTPSSSFTADRPGQVEKALAGSSARRAGRSVDRRPGNNHNKPSTPPDGQSGGDTAAASSVKLRSRSQGGQAPGARPRPASQAVTPSELDSVFARLAQPKRSTTPAAADSPRTTSATRDKRATPPAPSPAVSNNKKSPAPHRAPPAPRPGDKAPKEPKEPKEKEAKEANQRRRPATPPTKEKAERPPPAPPAARPGPESPNAAAAAATASNPSPQPADAEPSSLTSVTPEPALDSPDAEQPAGPAGPGVRMDVGYSEDSDSDAEPVALELEMGSIMTQSMPAVMVTSSSTKDLTEEEYRLRIAEQRRLAREKMERERQEEEAARAARAEQERLRREAARQMAEEARRRMEEEEERQRLEEERLAAEAAAAEVERLRHEEEERLRREAEERQAREAAEAERLERMAREEEERQARRARLNRIMSRVKQRPDGEPSSASGPDSGNSEAPSPVPPGPSPVPTATANTTTAAAANPACPDSDSPPAQVASNGRGASPVDGPRDESVSPPAPGRKSVSPAAEAPKFKSALLQSMMAGGRLSLGGGADGGLRRSSGSLAGGPQSGVSSGAGSEDAVNAAGNGSGLSAASKTALAGTGAAGGMPHSFSLDALSAAACRNEAGGREEGVGGDGAPVVRSSSQREMASGSLPNGDSTSADRQPDLCDEDEDVDGPALMSANIRTRLDEAKASRADGLRETDNTRTAFEEILNLPQSTNPNEHHLGAPVEPMPGAWFEQPPAQQQREPPVISDLLS